MLFFQAASRPERTHATMRGILDGKVELCVSPELIAEVQDVLTRSEHQARFPALTPEVVDAFIADIVSRASMFDHVPNVFTWPQHADDDHLFNLAICAHARFLVTWETRILKLGAESSPAGDLLRQLAPELAIVTPKTLADALKAGAPNQPSP
jgi:putative PIN family toxin of toxin-antitoxin system